MPEVGEGHGESEQEVNSVNTLANSEWDAISQSARTDESGSHLYVQTG